jgi:site-specific DNA-methyltransferase (adenine-specific)
MHSTEWSSPVKYYEDEWVTLYHGDCRELQEWTAADVLVTDPPYGIPGGRLSWHDGEPVHADASWDSVAIRDEALSMWGDRPRAVFGTPKTAAPEHRGSPLGWDKGNSPGMGDYTWPWGLSYELVYINGEGWSGKRRSSVLRSGHNSSVAGQVGHPTPKPVALMESLIEYAPPGVIADPFAGSGSTLIAARNLGRKAIGVELDEKYCELIVKRLGQQAFIFA